MSYIIDMRHGTFPIILQKEKEGGYSVTNLGLEGCYSQGETLEEALKNIKAATILCLEDEETPILEQEDISLHLLTV
jgi:predicted RNase H-like HicB family nuclease